MVEQELKQKVLDRFIPEPMSGCWLWTGTCNNYRYGAIKHKRKIFAAHRLSYEIHRGEVGTFCVLHKCDTPECINPEHLFLGTNSDNTQDRNDKGRQASGSRHGRYTRPEKTVHGEKHHKAKFTENDIREIRRSSENQITLAKIYNVWPGTICAILNGKTWKDVK